MNAFTTDIRTSCRTGDLAGVGLGLPAYGVAGPRVPGYRIGGAVLNQLGSGQMAHFGAGRPASSGSNRVDANTDRALAWEDPC